MKLLVHQVLDPEMVLRPQRTSLSCALACDTGKGLETREIINEIKFCSVYKFSEDTGRFSTLYRLYLAKCVQY